MSERRSTPGEAGIMISIAIVVAGLLWAIAWMATQAPQTSTAKDDGNRHASAQQSDRGSGPIEGQQGTPPTSPVAVPPTARTRMICVNSGAWRKRRNAPQTLPSGRQSLVG